MSHDPRHPYTEETFREAQIVLDELINTIRLSDRSYDPKTRSSMAPKWGEIASGRYPDETISQQMAEGLKLSRAAGLLHLTAPQGYYQRNSPSSRAIARNLLITDDIRNTSMHCDNSSSDVAEFIHEVTLRTFDKQSEEYRKHCMDHAKNALKEAHRRITNRNAAITMTWDNDPAR